MPLAEITNLLGLRQLGSHINISVNFSKEWKVGSDIIDKIQHFTPTIKEWNREVSGHIKKRKKSFMARIKDTQKAMERQFNPFLLKLESQL